MSRSNILFILTGSIACYKACQVISRLTQNGHHVKVIATKAALKFVGQATLEGLSGSPVLSEMYESGHAMDHIHLARWADLIIVAPATANYMNKIAHGLGDDLASTLFLAHDFKKPFLLAPAMNTMMYRHPTTQEALKKLLNMGVQVLESASGILACGETGYGRLLEADQILENIEKNLPLRNSPVEKTVERPISIGKTPIKILVTAGGTSEPIDDVRVITNTSTGFTGYKLARHFFEAGFDVELLKAENVQVQSNEDFPIHTFTTFQSLDSRLRDLLANGNFSHLVHAAAVSDYSIESISIDNKIVNPQKKLDSTKPLTLVLKSNPKLISRVKGYSPNNNLKVIGFKLTSHLSPPEAITKVDSLLATADYVVHNDLSEINKTTGQHRFTLWGLKKPRVYENVDQLSLGLIQAICTEVKS